MNIPIRLWMLFLLSFSLFLRNEVDRQIEKNRFNHLLRNDTFTVCLDKIQGCYFLEAEEAKETSSMLCNKTMKNPTPTCPKHLLLSENPSRMMQVGLGIFLLSLLLIKAFWLLRDWSWLRYHDKEQKRSNLPSRVLTLVTITIGMLSVFFAAFWEETGVIFLQFSVIILALYLLLVLLLQGHCFNVFKNKMVLATLAEPLVMMQILTLFPALIAVTFKNELMNTDNTGIINGITSLSIAMATGVVVIKMGNAEPTHFGHFATMFHLTLKKIPAQLFAVIYLLHGFSVGFWLLENRLVTENEEQDFTNSLKSFITVLSMTFGLTEFNFEGPFQYTDREFTSGEHINIVFAYILICLMVLLILLGLLNILLSTIIRDHKEMEEEVATNNIVFMAQHAMWSEYLKYANLWNVLKLPVIVIKVPIWICRQFHTEFTKDEKLLYCKSSFCANAVRNEVRDWKGWVTQLTAPFKVFLWKVLSVVLLYFRSKQGSECSNRNRRPACPRRHFEPQWKRLVFGQVA